MQSTTRCYYQVDGAAAVDVQKIHGYVVLQQLSHSGDGVRISTTDLRKPCRGVSTVPHVPTLFGLGATAGKYCVKVVSRNDLRLHKSAKAKAPLRLGCAEFIDALLCDMLEPHCDISCNNKAEHRLNTVCNGQGMRRGISEPMESIWGNF
eukprot:scaffold63565_cov24-Prasinocladus_malaysianus.AAC.2